jgi:hypothetical protein
MSIFAKFNLRDILFMIKENFVRLFESSIKDHWDMPAISD